jgi:polyphosphate kinase
MVRQPAAPLGDESSMFINRELSWLEFNSRVLDQARDRRVPLLERVKFVAIFGSNLDEFFMVRVAGLHEQLQSKVAATAPDQLTVNEQLTRIRERVLTLTAEATTLLHGELLPALERHGVRVVRWDSLSPAQTEWARAYFRTHVFPVLTPLAVDPAHPFPFISNLSLSLAVEAVDPTTGERGLVRIKVPESLPRFIKVESATSGRAATAPITSATDFLPLEELITGNLGELSRGMEIVSASLFRVTRDTDNDILEDDAADLLTLIDQQVRQRRLGAAVRLEIPPSLPPRLRAMLTRQLELDEEDVYEQGGLLALSGLFGLASLHMPELRDPPLAVNPNLDWEEGDPFAVIASRDVILHHPQDSFDVVLNFLRRAADDPDVLAIKMTLYRAGSNSDAVRSLIRAAENGKQVAVSVELQARFDEATNIAWARAFGQSGVHVFFGAAGQKTHAKILLVVRRERGALKRYVHIGTGNYNASTAKVYVDLGYFTAREAVGEDACDLFNMLSGFSRPTAFRTMLVAPLNLRTATLARIAEQTERAKSGKPAYIFAKLNALVDPEIIRALYTASQAGVDVDLVVRGICCLRPKVPGVSDRIRVLSLLGRFLEHGRIYAFGPPGAQDMFIGSADWMQRNLDRRVEVMVPVVDAHVCERLRQECMRPLRHDGAIYELGATGDYTRVTRDGEAASGVVRRLA